MATFLYVSSADGSHLRQWVHYFQYIWSCLLAEFRQLCLLAKLWRKTFRMYTESG